MVENEEEEKKGRVFDEVRKNKRTKMGRKKRNIKEEKI